MFAVAGAGWWLARILAAPDSVLLVGEDGSRWIGPRVYHHLGVWVPRSLRLAYRTHFEIDAVPRSALLTVRALTSVGVSLDGRVVLPQSRDPARQQIVRSVDLRPWLTPGRHELEIIVVNSTGPPLLLAHGPELGIATAGDGGWAASIDGESWIPVKDVDDRILPPYFAALPTSADALIAQWPVFGGTFVLAGGLALIASSSVGWLAGVAARLGRLRARHLRSTLLLAWLALSVNSLLRIPLDFGFDVEGHTEYIRFIAEQARIPLASDGWEMFQSPLYYVIAALPYRFAALTPPLTPTDLPRALLLIPLLCGAVQIQLAYVATRRVFPAREDLQALGTLVAGLMPINLYSSQHIGNEPLAGVLSAASLVVALGLLAPAAPSGRRRDWVLIGALLGLAMLTKSTAVLLLPPVLLTAIWKASGSDRDLKRLAARLGFLLLTAFLVCGWYYVRNWIELGRPVLVGTGSWWQDPGYRTPRDFYAFGAALGQPLYASVYGFWNGLYASLWTDAYYSGWPPRPGSVMPWAEEFVIAGSLLGLVPSLALVVGVARSPSRLQTLLASLCVLTFTSAMLYLYLRVPHFSAVKASYTLGLLPAYAVLAASGLEPMIRNRGARSVIVGALACWAMASYRAYFASAA